MLKVHYLTLGVSQQLSEKQFLRCLHEIIEAKWIFLHKWLINS